MADGFRRPLQVDFTADLQRIRDMPWQPWAEAADLEQWTEWLNAQLTTGQMCPGATVEGGMCSKCGTPIRLRPIQAAALARPFQGLGLFAPIIAGGGKTLIFLLAPSAFALGQGRAPVTVGFTPASLRAETFDAMRRYSRHWKLLPQRHLSYSELSHQDHADVLERETWRPELILMDEAHEMGNSSGPRWTRVTKYRQLCKRLGRPDPVPLLMSGSFENRSRDEYWHLIRWTHGRNAPVPNNIWEFRSWCGAIDSKVKEEDRVDVGALLELAPSDPVAEEGMDPIDIGRSRYGRRLMATHGVVGSNTDMPEIPIEAKVLRYEPSAPVLAASEHMRATSETPCGIPFEGKLELWRLEREASAGFYGIWDPQPPQEWRTARKAISIVRRAALDMTRKYETPAQVDAAIERGEFPWGEQALREWQAIRDTFKPVTVPQWMCEQALTIASRWLREVGGLCWVHHIPFGEKLSALTGIPYFHDRGMDHLGRKIDMWGGPAIASIKSCSRGFNLQGMAGKKANHSHNLVVTSPTTNKDYEQLLARTHRRGQKADKITLTVMVSLEGDMRALEQAMEDSRCVSLTKQAPQRLQVAKWLDA